MKNSDLKRYYKNGKLTWTQSVFEGWNGGKRQYRFMKREKEGVLLEVDYSKEGVLYVEQYGVHYEEKRKRSNSLKWTGTEITKEEFEQTKRDWKFEAATNREAVGEQQAANSKQK